MEKESRDWITIYWNLTEQYCISSNNDKNLRSYLFPFKEESY